MRLVSVHTENDFMLDFICCYIKLKINPDNKMTLYTSGLQQSTYL